MQQITFPTHDRGSMINLIISHTSNQIVYNHSIVPLFSDHFALLFNLNHPKQIVKLVQFSSTKNAHIASKFSQIDNENKFTHRLSLN